MNVADIRSAVLDVIYPLPRSFDTAEADDRLAHRDLLGRALADLAREHERVRLRLLLDDAPDDWFLERLHHLDAVLSRAPAR